MSVPWIGLTRRLLYMASADVVNISCFTLELSSFMSITQVELLQSRCIFVSFKGLLKLLLM